MSFTAKPNADGSVQLQVNGVDRIVLRTDGGVDTGNPAFYVRLASDFSLSDATFTVVPVSTTIYDTHDCFNSAATTQTLGNGLSVGAYCFKPHIAGYYLLQATAYFAGVAAAGNGLSRIMHHDGVATSTEIARDRGTLTANIPTAFNSAGVFYFDGVNDYAWMESWQNTGAARNAVASYTTFSGILLRAA